MEGKDLGNPRLVAEYKLGKESRVAVETASTVRLWEAPDEDGSSEARLVRTY